MDELKHLAKVRVAGSNPVFRSIIGGQKQFFQPLSLQSCWHTAGVQKQYPRIPLLRGLCNVAGRARAAAKTVASGDPTRVRGVAVPFVAPASL
jgi:hypothetical protein